MFKRIIVVLFICASTFINRVDAQVVLGLESVVHADSMLYGENMTIDLVVVNKGSNCDSLQTYIVGQTQYQIDFISNADSIGIDSVVYYWYVYDLNGNLNHQSFNSSASVVLPPSPNLDTILACLYIEDFNNSLPHCNICDTLVWDGTHWIKTITLIDSGPFTYPINLNFASQSLNNPNLTLVPIYLPLTIYPHFGFTTGDSINLSIQFINVNSQSFLQTGGGVVIIWPSSVGPITADTSFTPIYITNTNTSIVEELVNEKLNGKIIDILGREIYDYNNLPKGSIYIRNGKKFIIQKD
tara:strand:- start:98 stop:991 length:894 start_codon:yes stop_codon:yes gene_type:complete